MKKKKNLCHICNNLEITQETMEIMLTRIFFQEQILIIFNKIVHCFDDYRFFEFNTADIPFHLIDIFNKTKEKVNIFFVDELKILKQYSELVKINDNFFPTFIFGEEYPGSTMECINYINDGHTLIETEEFFYNKFSKQNIK